MEYEDTNIGDRVIMLKSDSSVDRHCRGTVVEISHGVEGRDDYAQVRWDMNLGHFKHKNNCNSYLDSLGLVSSNLSNESRTKNKN